MARETLGSRLGFLLLTAGCAIGLGNIWRFPFMAGKYGGAAFVLLYIFFLAVLGYPLMMMELAVGRASRRSLCGIGVLAKKGNRIWSAFGTFFCLGCAVLMMYYTTVTGWMIAYGVKFGTGVFQTIPPENSGEMFGKLTGSARECTVYMLVAVFFGTAVCSLGLRNGVERVNKILMGGLFLFLGGLCVKSLLLPGAGAGLEFYLKPNFGNLTKEAVPAAMNQAFFTLSIGIGSIAIFGSYIDKSRSLAREAQLIIFLDTLVALLAGMVIFPVCLSHHVPVGQGPGLIFVSLPRIFCEMSGGRWWGALFFAFMSMAALTTVIAVFENLIAVLMDGFGMKRYHAAWLTGLFIGVFSLPCALGFNKWSSVRILGKDSTILDFEDYIVSDNLLPLGGLFLLIFCLSRYGWGLDNLQAEINTGSGMKLPAVYKPLMRWVLPLLIVLIYIVNFAVRWF